MITKNCRPQYAAQGDNLTTNAGQSFPISLPTAKADAELNPRFSSNCK